jgi:hypothetical protein
MVSGIATGTSIFPAPDGSTQLSGTIFTCSSAFEDVSNINMLIPFH